MMRIGIMGAAFNPPTLGHKDLVMQALEEVDEVWLVPSYSHAFSKQMLPYDIRCSLLVDFAADIGLDRVVAKPLEHLLYRDGPVYTWDLLSYIEANKAPGTSITFLMGPDNKENWSKFYRADDIARQWPIFVAKETKEIRSTMVRQAIQSGLPIEQWVTKRVGERIGDLGLYREAGNAK